ncbi:beta strand repeat-containing protein [Scleromatobacter humisilvae]|uniref:Choice-of-anchor D domain-containing protein n=1 Tax=Scleromatobacter humisilvae TaxID=2897159 RepID=A0A9X1YL38_9BURK|nr:choice-of-anchor D domain-containing protein [Scleromatobacter humisilvae]MCK9687941.1 choice-of-anchor D domain-containing protein [Scleromatobacter humisilvae]
MPMTRNPFARTSLALAAFLVMSAAPTHSAFAGASCTWVPASGDWSNAGNWSCGLVPTGPAQDNASISVGKTVTVSSAQSIFGLTNAGGIDVDAFTLTLQSGGSTTNSGTINVGTVSVTASLQAFNDIANTGGVIKLANGSFLNQFSSAITGGTINTTGTGALMVFSSNNNALSGVTVNGLVDMSANVNSRERVSNGLTLNGTINIANGGLLSLDSTGTPNQTIAGTGTVNLNDAGAHLSVEGNGTTTLGAGITVQGQGNIGTATFVGGTNTLVNNGHIVANVNAGTLTIAPPGNSGSVINNGTLSATSGGTLALQATVANGGTISALNGSVVEQDGIRVTGGAITTSGSGVFRAASNGNNYLDGVGVTGTLDMATLANSREHIVNGLTLNGNVNIANGGILSLDSVGTTGGAQTISGTASINLNDAAAILSVEGNGSTTLGSGITVHGQGNIGRAVFVGGNNTFTSNGLISSDVNGGTLEITAPGNSGSFVNNGTLQAINGGTLTLSTNIVANPGSQIISGTGSTVLQNGVTINGTFTSSGGGLFTASSSNNNILNAVTFSGNLDASSLTNARERIGNNLTLNGAVNIANGGLVSLDSTIATDNAISGHATFNLNDPSALLSVEGTGTTTLGANVIVRGQGTFAQAVFVGGNNTLTNNGLVSADVAGGTLTIRPPGNSGTFINNGTLQAVGGGILNLSTSVDANAGSQILAANGSQVVQTGVTLNGAINTMGTGVLTVTSNGNNVLDAVTLNGTLDAASMVNSRERIVNGLTINGVVNIANGGIVSLDSVNTTGGAQTISGTASFNLNSPDARLSIEGTGSTTLGSGIVVHGQGNVGTAVFVGGANTLINHGRISADASGGTLTFGTPGNSGILQNEALVDARNGGTLMLSTNVANAGGTLAAQTGSTVVQNGVTITGGTLSTAGTGAIVVTSSNANILDGVTIAGLVDMSTSVNSRERVIDGATLNGAINIANGGILSLDSTSVPNQTINGTGSINLNDPGARLTIEGTGTTTIASGVTLRGQGNLGAAVSVGGNNTLTNNGLILADVAGGTLTIAQPANSGALVGSGTLQANGGTLALATNGDITQGKLVIGAAGSAVTLDGHNVIITSDYTNAQSGSGNAFDRHAAVTGAGSIVAGGNAAQAITGAGITNGSTTNATLTLGNVRVGANTVDYRIANTGTSGPTLRGAIQTSVNGANITDSRLSGAGVTAANYNTGGPGANTGDLGVTFTVTSAGTLAPLTGQAINLRSNFDNIADQKLNIVLASGAAAYQAAAGQIQTPSLNFGTVQVGQTVSQGLVIRNTASGAAGFVEDLNAAFGASNGTGASLITGTGSLNGILAGTSSTSANGAMTVTVNTAAAGTVNGSITVDYTTAGKVNGVSNGLGTASVGSENYGVAGTIQAIATVVNAASPVVNTPAIALGAHRVGDAAPSAFVSITNQATTAPQAALDATLTSGGAPVTASGSVNLLAPGATSASQLVVGLSTANAGDFTGANAKSATLNLVSDAANIGGCGNSCQMTLASQQVAVTGKVYSPAAAQVNTTTVDFGVVHTGDVIAARGISVTNSGPTSALSDVLRGSLGNAGGAFTTGGSFASLAAQSTDATSLTASLDTTSSGVFLGSATATFASHDADLADLPLGSSVIALKGTVDNYAKVALEQAGGPVTLTQAGNVYTLDFGTLAQGSAGLDDTLAVLNSATGLADLLSGSFTPSGSAPGFDLSGFGAFSGLGAGEAKGGLTVDFDTGTVGSFEDTITLHATGSNASGYSAALDDVTLVLEGQVTGPTTTPVPEPGMTALLLAGLGVLFGLRRRRGAEAER